MTLTYLQSGFVFIGIGLGLIWLGAKIHPMGLAPRTIYNSARMYGGMAIMSLGFMSLGLGLYTLAYII